MLFISSQESCAIAKMTARIARYISGSNELLRRYGGMADPYDLPLPPNGGSICPKDTRMVISPQRVIRCTSCLVLGYGFQGRRIEWRYFRLHQIQVGGIGRHLG